ncbi:MAG: hypothetical protein A2X49_10755 [Lentisphaerae bacterium GWF2_52_8]|nr:MAG: hypothetical protein A2X49_10755 [Lentisphaerae bacterium GWF2_52_8]
MQTKYHVKKGDSVTVLSGNWKGEEAKILAVLKKKDRVVLELKNLTQEKQDKLGRRTVRKSNTHPNGGLVERAVSTHVSNVAKKAE